MIKRLKLIKRQRNKRGDSKRAASATNANSNTHSMDHSHSEDQLWGAVEIIPQRLYYAPLKFFPPETEEEEEEEEEGNDDDGSSDSKSENKQQPSHHHHHHNANQQRKRKKSIHYFSIDNELIYWNFFLDFGPLNLGQLYRFSSRLNAKLSSPEYKDDIICYYSGARGQQKANATFLICAWQMLYLGRSLEDSWFGWRENNHDQEEEEEEEGDGTSGSLASDNRAGNTSLPPQSRPKRSHKKSNNNESSSSGSGSSSIHATADDDDDDNNRLGRHRLDGSGKQQVPSPFARIHPLPPFHDASPIVCTYDLSVYDCLRGLDKARKFGFFKFGNAPTPGSDVVVGGGAIESSSSSSATATATSSSPPPSIPPVGTKPPRHPSDFDANEYEHFEQVENGDLNWIVQNKILAFAGPQNTKVITPEGFCMLTPSDYIPYFVKSNVKLVVRLNKKCYDESEFENAGIRHVEHYYLDGSCPPLRILHAVVADMETLDEDAAMAVHCKAGLGRTGTCIGAYLMKHYRLTAREVIGWMRICRPGMVIGPQQHFLADVEGLMWQEGEMMYGRPERALLPPYSSSTSVGESDESEVAATADTTFDTPSKPPSATVVSPESAATTPDDNNAVAGGVAVDVPSGAHAAIVTPDGKPLRIPPTPVVARKLDLGVKRDAAIMMDNMALISPKSCVAASSTSDDNGDRVMCSTPSSTGSLPNTLDALKVDSSSSSSSSSSPNGPTTDGQQQQLLAKEGDQANALLLRRLDQYQARQNEKA